MSRKPNVREARITEIEDSRVAYALREGLADLLEDVYSSKRQYMVSMFRQGKTTPESLVAFVAQLAMAEELLEGLDRRIQRGRKAIKEEHNGA